MGGGGGGVKKRGRECYNTTRLLKDVHTKLGRSKIRGSSPVPTAAAVTSKSSGFFYHLAHNNYTVPQQKTNKHMNNLSQCAIWTGQQFI